MLSIKMTKNTINIKRELHKKFLKDYFIIEAFSNDDHSEYLIDKIIEGTKEENNRNFVTNVSGKMTHWQYFANDEIFLKTVSPLLNYLEHQVDLHPYILCEAWGLIEGLHEYTKKHDHASNVFSGIVYLNDHNQELFFPEVNIKIKPEKNKIVLFSAFLKHQADRNFEEDLKYAIAFNCSAKPMP